jgi:hypothetical protein
MLAEALAGSRACSMQGHNADWLGTACWVQVRHLHQSRIGQIGPLCWQASSKPVVGQRPAVEDIAGDSTIVCASLTLAGGCWLITDC